MSESTIKQHEETYNNLLKFYDYAEELIDTVDNKSVTDKVAQLNFIEPMVEEMEDAADILTEEYRNYVKTGKKPGVFSRKKIEKSLARIYSVLCTCNNARKQN